MTPFCYSKCPRMGGYRGRRRLIFRYAAIFLLTCICGLLPAMVYGATSRPTLSWGADSEGGAPYVFQDPKHPNKTIGFEVDIAAALGKLLHRRPVFVQNEWTGLIPGLERSGYDMAMNGLGITAARQKVVAFSLPYYVCSEQLMVRKSTRGVHGLADLRGKIVGTLRDSTGERILHAFGGIHVRSYDGQINAYQDLANGRLDAVLMDLPIAEYYGSPVKTLKFVGPPIGRINYGIALRKTDVKLRGQINRALVTLMRNGTLEKIYKKWALWNLPTKKLFAATLAAGAQPNELSRFTRMVQAHHTWLQVLRQYAVYLRILVEKGAPMTIAISISAMVLAVALGLFLALFKLYAPAPLAWLAKAYIELVRGTPLLIQLYLIFYGLPNIGIRLSPFVAAVLGLGMNYAAYEAENYRAGIESIPRGQWEASLSLGMSHLQTLRHVIIPQAIRTCLPPVTNDFISLFKDSSIVSVITMVELTKVYGELASTYYDYIGIGLLTAAIYFLIGWPFVRLSRWLELRLPGGRQGYVPGAKPVNAG